MKLGIIKARIKRNKFAELAGKYYRDENSGIVKYLNSTNKNVFAGIEREDGVYTIIGEEYVFYVTPSGVAGKISLAYFLNILGKNALAKGKRAQFDFVNVNEADAVWLLNEETMCAMWTTILMLCPDY
jgi:hypothetical protein